MPTLSSNSWSPVSRLSRVAVLILASGGTAPHVWACRYSVRDVTFAPLRADPYRLVIEIPGDAGVELRRQLQRAARAALFHTNIEVELADGAARGAGVTLIAPDGRRLELELEPEDGRKGTSESVS